MAGLLGMGRQSATQAQEGFSRVSNLERERDNQNEQIEAADDAAQTTNTATGATAGYMVGAGMSAAGGAAAGAEAGTAFGPWGMAIGAVAGYLMSEWL